MKAWDSIESLAEDVGISPRTGYRWLKEGKIKRKREDGRILFVLAGGPTDITDTDVTDMSATDVSSDIPDILIVSKKSDKEDHQPLSSIGKKVIPMMTLNPNPSTGLRAERERTELSRLKVVQAEDEKKLKEIEGPAENPLVAKKKIEVELTELSVREFEAAEKLEALKEKVEEKRLEREAQQKLIEEKNRIRAMIDEIKERVLPFEMHTVIPAGVIFVIYKRIEEALLKCDFHNLSHSEAILIAENVLTECVNDPELQPIIQDSLHDNLMTLTRKQFNEAWKLFYQDYLERGGKLS